MQKYAVGIAGIAFLAALFLWQSGGISLVAPEQHVLSGSSTPEGDYVYTEEGPYHMIDVFYPAKTSLSFGADRAARLSMEEGLKGLIDEFKANGKFEEITEEDAEFQGLGDERKYALAAEYKQFASPTSVSYVFPVYEDMLGAHPNTYFRTFTFDMDGKKLALRDLFLEGADYLARIAPLAVSEIERLIIERAGEGAEESLFREGLAPTEENYQHFFIDGETLAILFPPYQVAAYAAGHFKVKIPFSELQDILK